MFLVPAVIVDVEHAVCGGPAAAKADPAGNSAQTPVLGLCSRPRPSSTRALQSPHHRGHFYRAQRLQSGSGAVLPGNLGRILGPSPTPTESTLQQTAEAG